MLERTDQMHTRSAGFVSFGLVGVALAACGLAFGADARTYVTSNYFLTIDGVKTGFIKTARGGGISAQVINETAGSVPYVMKHIGQPKYEPLSIALGFSNSKAPYEWIKATWGGSNQRKNVSVDETDAQSQSKSSRAYSGCLITETTIPAMDGTSKEPAYLTLKTGCESMREVQASNIDTGKYGKNEQKVFLPSNFKLEIDGLDCTRVKKIDAFTVKRLITSDSTGQARDSQKQPDKIDFPDLKITLAGAGAASWKQWFDDFVVKGNSSQAKEKSGTLTLLTPNAQKMLARIHFFNMGIHRLEPTAVEANSESAASLTVELYVERMEFEYAADVIG
jgi:hypothetical protein